MIVSSHTPNLELVTVFAAPERWVIGSLSPGMQVDHVSSILTHSNTRGGATPWPNGTVTFLFTDITSSTALWEQQSAAMRAALARHDALVEQIVAAHHGHVVRPRGRATAASSSSPALPMWMRQPLPLHGRKAG